MPMELRSNAGHTYNGWESSGASQVGFLLELKSQMQRSKAEVENNAAGRSTCIFAWRVVTPLYNRRVAIQKSPSSRHAKMGWRSPADLVPDDRVLCRTARFDNELKRTKPFYCRTVCSRLLEEIFLF